MTLKDLANELKKKFQSFTSYTLPQTAARVASSKPAQFIENTQRFIESPRGLEPIPKFTTQKPGFLPQVGTFAKNLPIDIANTIIGKGIISPLRDVGQVARADIYKQNLPSYESLGQVGRLGYQVAGVAPRTLKQFAGNIAGIAEAPLMTYFPTPVKGLVTNVAKNIAKETLGSVTKQGVFQGAKYGGLFGLAQGLQEGRNIPDNFDYLKVILKDVGGGMGAGAILGGALSAGGYTLSKFINVVKRVTGTQDTKEAVLVGGRYLIDESTGKFRGSIALRKKEPKYYNDLREELGLPRNEFSEFDIKQIKLGAGIKEITPEERLRLKPTQATKGVEPKIKGIAEAPVGRISIPQVEKSTTQVGKITPKIELPVSMGGKLPSGQQPSSLVPSIDPVQKIINVLKEAKPLEKKQVRIYAKIRSQQAGAVAGVGKKIPGEAGYFAQLGQLKGEMPKVEFESIRKQITQPDIDSLFNKVEQAAITPFEKVTAKTGLAKLLGAEGGSVPVQSELKLLNEIFPPEFIQAVLDKRSTFQKLFSLGTEALNLPRAMMATADMSAPLRQGVFLIGKPKQWLPAFKEQFKYFFSEKAYKGLAEDIKARPTYQAMREGKLALTDLSPMLQTREEAFMSNLAEKIPGFGKLARASNRAYSGFLNKLRADVFDDLYKTAKTQGLIKENPNLVNDIAKFVNSATGRGNLGSMERVAPVLNGVFFSPRLMASRLNLLNPRFYATLDPFVRKEALKSLLTFAGTGLSVLTLAHLGGAEVGTNPTSSDFGKIKIGNTRLDIWGGFQQYFRAAGQLISGKYTSSTTGKEYTLGEGYKPLTRLGILGKVIEAKEAPVVSFVSQLLTGQSALGGKLDIPIEIANRFIPMVVADMYDLYKEGGLADVGLAVPAIFGVGVQTYGKQIPNLEITPSGKPTIKLKPVPGMAEDIMAKIRGTQPSNIPLEQQQGMVGQIQEKQQQKIQLDKLKQQLEAGQVPTTLSNQDFEAAKLMFGYSSLPYQAVGNTLLYKNDNGGVSTTSLDFDIEIPKSTGNDTLDKELLADYRGSITTAKNAVMKAFEVGYLKQDQAIKELEKLTAQAEATKVKKPKKITIKYTKTKAPTIKVKKAKATKVPTIKFTKPKIKTTTIPRKYTISP